MQTFIPNYQIVSRVTIRSDIFKLFEYLLDKLDLIIDKSSLSKSHGRSYYSKNSAMILKYYYLCSVAPTDDGNHCVVPLIFRLGGLAHS